MQSPPARRYEHKDGEEGSNELVAVFDLYFTNCFGVSRLHNEGMVNMKFSVFQMADIGTTYLEPGDLDLLETAPCHIAEVTFEAAGIEDKTGSIFYVPDDSERLLNRIDQMLKHGMSERFTAIFKQLHIQGISYVRFDRDGEDIEGIEPCDHS